MLCLPTYSSEQFTAQAPSYLSTTLLKLSC